MKHCFPVVPALGLLPKARLPGALSSKEISSCEVEATPALLAMDALKRFLLLGSLHHLEHTRSEESRESFSAEPALTKKNNALVGEHYG